MMHEPLGPLGPYATIVDEEEFTLLTEMEIRKALRLQYAVSVLAILPDPQGIEEIPVSDPLVGQLAGVISRTVRNTDVVSVTASASGLRVLLVDAHSDHLPVVIRRISQEVRHHGFAREGRSVTVSVGGACFPATARSSQDLLAQATVRARRAREGSDAP